MEPAFRKHDFTSGRRFRRESHGPRKQGPSLATAAEAHMACDRAARRTWHRAQLQAALKSSGGSPGDQVLVLYTRNLRLGGSGSSRVAPLLMAELGFEPRSPWLQSPRCFFPGQVALILHVRLKSLFHAFSFPSPLSQHLKLPLENAYTPFPSFC